MIVSNRKNASGGKSTVVQTNSFSCMISTAKEGLRKTHATMILEIQGLDAISVGRPLANIVYSPSLPTFDCLEIHDVISGILNIAGDGSATLYEAIDEVCLLLKERGVIAEAIKMPRQQNLWGDGGSGSRPSV